MGDAEQWLGTSESFTSAVRFVERASEVSAMSQEGILTVGICLMWSASPARHCPAESAHLGLYAFEHTRDASRSLRRADVCSPPSETFARWFAS